MLCLAITNNRIPAAGMAAFLLDLAVVRIIPGYLQDFTGG
jgi:hypothetical protein